MSAVIKLIKTRSLVLKLTSLGLDLSLEGSGLSLKERLEKKKNKYCIKYITMLDSHIRTGHFRQLFLFLHITCIIQTKRPTTDHIHKE